MLLLEQTPPHSTLPGPTPCTVTAKMVDTDSPPLASPFRTSTPANQKRSAQQPFTTAYVEPMPIPLAQPARYPTFKVLCKHFEVSEEMLFTISPVQASVSKELTSCFRMACRYRTRIRAACRSPVCIHAATSALRRHITRHITSNPLHLGL